MCKLELLKTRTLPPDHERDHKEDTAEKKDRGFGEVMGGLVRVPWSEDI